MTYLNQVKIINPDHSLKKIYNFGIIVNEEMDGKELEK